MGLRGALWTIVAVVGAIALRSSPWIGWIEEFRTRASISRELFEEGEAAWRAGQVKEARDNFLGSLAALPAARWYRSYPLRLDRETWGEVRARAERAAGGVLGRFVRGHTLRKEGRWLEAASELERLGGESTWWMSFYGHVWDPWLEAARARAQAGDGQGSLRDLTRARVKTGLEVLAMRAWLADHRTVVPEAKQRDLRALWRLHDPCSALYAYGEAAAEMGDWEGAAAAFGTLEGALPHFDYVEALERMALTHLMGHGDGP